MKIRFWAHFCGIIFYKKNAFKNFRRQIMFDFLTFAQCWIFALPKKCPYSEFFWSAFFLHFPAFGLNTAPYLSVFSPNAGKYGKNADQNNSEYGLFLLSVVFMYCAVFVSFQKFLKNLNYNHLIYATTLPRGIYWFFCLFNWQL